MGADRAAFRLSAKAGTYGEDAASETQYSRTSPLPLSDTAFLQVDLCITMSALRRNASQDAPRPLWDVAQMCAQAPALSTSGTRLTESIIRAICDAERHGMHANAEHWHDQYRAMIVPMLCVGMPPRTLRVRSGMWRRCAPKLHRYPRQAPGLLNPQSVPFVTRSVTGGTPTRSDGHDQCRGGLLYNDERRVVTITDLPAPALEPNAPGLLTFRA